MECLLQTLEHENLDVVVETITLFSELTDEELIVSHADSLKNLVDKLHSNSITSLLYAILKKVPTVESEPSGGKKRKGLQGTETTLLPKMFTLMENLLNCDPLTTANKFMHNDNLMDFLMFALEGKLVLTSQDEQ